MAVARDGALSEFKQSPSSHAIVPGISGIHPSRVLHRSLRASSLQAVGGRGCWLHLADGRRVLDAAAGAAVSALGHGHPRVVEAICEQTRRLAYDHTGTYTNAEALADELVGAAPGGLTHAWFVSSGSEGVEAALKLVRQYWVKRGEPGRGHVIARRQSYHGNTCATS